jgi:crotonobetainyl-CoA:carnitine CoA-transferase CaiB-like acyl-CoA transferase
VTETSNNGPLADLRVVEMGQLIAGPFCGQLLGDMGAEVIKLEAPGAGDPMRGWGQGAPVWWEVIARNKQSASVNLRTADGQDLARRLIATADVLVENFRPGTLEGWNLSPERLMAENPRLIVARMSGYGQSGPYADRTAFGLIGEAMGGWRHIVGEPDRPPSRMGVSIGDTLAASYGCMGVLAALHDRERTGKGQIIDSALYEAVLQVMEAMIPEYAIGGVTRERSGAILPGIAPSNVYRCKDGDYLIGANQNGIFRRLCDVMGRPELADDPRYATHAARGERQAELDALIETWTREHTIADVEALMIEAGVPAGKLYRAPEMLADPHFAARQAIVKLPHPRWGEVPMQNAFPKLSRTPGAVRSIAPQSVGQDNEAVWGGILAIDAEERAKLAADGVI